jgi:predicted amidohydrolase YtcJ
MSRGPDLIVENANVRTMVGNDTAEAVAIVDRRISAVGSNAEIAASAGPSTIRIDAQGGTVLPSVIDSHTHFHRAAIFRALFLDFDELGSASVADIVEAVAERARSTPAGTWIEGDNLRDHRLAERRWPVRGELDAVAPDHPVVLRSLGKHLVIANSLALRIAGIDRETEDPPGGKLDRDETGEITGVLHETAKLRLDSARVDSVVPPVSEEDRLAALRTGIAQLQQNGVSTIHEIVTRPDEIADFMVLRERGELGVRIRYYVRGVEAQTSLDQLLKLGLRSGFGDEWISIGGIKVSVDGSCESRNAALYEPYPGQPDNRGMLRVSQPQLNALVADADRGGLQMAIHAIGPRAADMALTAYEATLTGRGNERLRHRLEHMYVAAPREHFERAKRLGLVMSEQPGLIYASGDAWHDIFKTEGLKTMMPLRMMLDMGIPVQANSDFPSTPMNPFIGVRGAVDRHSRNGTPIDPSQAVTVDEVTRMMTTMSAFTTREEHVTGSIRPGYRADLRIVDRDPYTTPPKELDAIRTQVAILDGSVVHSDGAVAAEPVRA